MLLTELTAVPDEALPVDPFKDHLRLGTGIAAPSGQDGLYRTTLRAAIAVIEARTAKALLERRFRWRLSAWRDLSRQSLPVAPVSALVELSVTTLSGATDVIDPAAYRLEPDASRPSLVSRGFVLPTIPVGGAAEITFDAGYGPDWGDVPADLGQAVLMLAAHFYETRGAPESEALPDGVMALISSHRRMRLLGGHAR